MSQKRQRKIKRALTLVEILITLGIIGVVSALTIPNIITHFQKQKTVTKLKKAYSQVNQALLLSAADNGDYDGWDNPEEIGATEYFKKYWLPYFKGITLCKDYEICTYQHKNNSSFNYLNNKESGIDAIFAGRSSILLPDGTILINFLNFNNDYNKRNSWLYIDINGTELPNIIGKDVFTFERNERGIIIPRCNSDNISQVNADCSKRGTGLCCAKKIINDGWSIAKDYPW
ncbi:type II secretion system protein [bacterium]|nr:type II secretion system protein [bacterium]